MDLRDKILKEVDDEMDNVLNWVTLIFIAICLFAIPSCLSATGDMHINAQAYCADKDMVWEQGSRGIGSLCYNDEGETRTVRERNMWCDPIYFDPKKGVCENG